jgi:hypothetical protein
MKRIFALLLAASVFALPNCTDDKKSDEKDSTTSSGKKDDTVAETDLPAPVINAFKAKYPNATAVEWETAKENDQPTYKAKWKEGETKMKVEFSQDGQFIKEEKD